MYAKIAEDELLVNFDLWYQSTIAMKNWVREARILRSLGVI